MLQSYVGGALFGERRGVGETDVVALHGWGRSHLDFAEVLHESSGLSSVAFDLPGFGASPPPSKPWGTPEYAQLISEALIGLKAPPVIVGHSFGGLVAVRLARAHPEAVRALVLTGVPLFRPTGGVRSPRAYRVVRGLARIGLVSPARLEQSRQRHGSADYRQASGVMREVLVRRLGEDYEEDLRVIISPVSLVWGARDTAAPLEVARRAEDLLLHAELIVVPDVGHQLPVDAPLALRAAIRAHLG